MLRFEIQYQNLLKKVLSEGFEIKGRNGLVKTLIGQTLKFDANIIPLMTARKINYLAAFGEMAAFLRGPKNLTDFEKFGCNYWTNWAKVDKTINIDYGNKWLNFNGVNQLENILIDLKQNPFSRRILLTSWDPLTLNDLDLPCCHYAYQFIVDNEKKLHLVWTQRSLDLFVGAPYDFLLAFALVHIIAKAAGLKVGEVTMNFAHCHVYSEHFSLAKKYISNPLKYPAKFNNNLSDNIYAFSPEDFEVYRYSYFENLKPKVIK